MGVGIPRHSTIRPAAFLLATDLDSGKETEREVAQCIHCQRMWIIQPGSGIKRGYCLKCMGVTCGRPACDDDCPGCIEKRIELFEAGKLARL